MPHITYPAVIAESVDELHDLEHQHRGRPTRPRLHLLRLLKSGQVTTLGSAADILGYSERTCARWWGDYRCGGLAQLLDYGMAPGRQPLMTEVAWQGLETAMTAGEIVTLKDAQRYLAETWDVSYQSLNGVWEQIRSRQAKKKTGRRRHRQADPEAQEEYKR